ncbi:MAG: alpha/beta fold hydrolase, partial [Roseiflexaceae bacterium]|nr:alpha/beta fold hydrolase [Roseiflexaceae bacterium]
GPDHDYTLTALAQDTLAFADALGLDRFHLVGHSLGAGVAMQLALDDGDRVLSLAVVAPPWVDGMPAEANSPERQQMLKANFDLFAMALKALAPATAPDDAFWHRLARRGARATARGRRWGRSTRWRSGRRATRCARLPARNWSSPVRTTFW